MAIDFNDPATWPNDGASLEALAKADTTIEVEPGAKEGTSAPAAATGTEPQPPAETAAQPGDKGGEPSGVQTRDGKHIMPYSVLQQEREEKAALKARTEELERDLEAARLREEQSRAVAAKPLTMEEKLKAVQLTEETTKQIEQMREDGYDDAVIKLYERQYRMEALLAAQEHAERERRSLDAHEAAKQTEQEVMDALLSNATMKSWMESKPVLLKTSQEVNAELLNSQGKGYDPAYAAMSWHERMQVLPGKTLEYLGVQVPAATPNAGSNGQQKPAAPEVPFSIGALPSGSAPATNQVGDLERLSGSQIAHKLRSMSPQEYAKFIATIS